MPYFRHYRFRKHLGVLLGLLLSYFLLLGATAAEQAAQAGASAIAAPAAASCKTMDTKRVNTLLGRMTLDEKIGQLVLFTSGGVITGPSGEREDLARQIEKGNCGAVFNAHTVARIRQLQGLAIEKTRLKIPLLFGYDVIHGYKTVFPIPLAEACSWDLKAIEKSERVAALEATAGGLNWTFAPMVDIARDPRWGRIAEGAGEDPFLGAAIARARVRGFQGEHLGSDASSLLACVKHFAAYGAAQAGRDYHAVDLSERTLREVYLPPYQAALDAGAMSVMCSFNELNGVPMTANGDLLNGVLRDEWGFKGFVVTDYTAINELVKHGTAADEYEAGRQALLAGVDMDMQGGVYLDHLKRMVAKGDIDERQIDEAVRRILLVKCQLGLFDDPYRYCDEARETRLTGSAANLQAAREMASQSMVLLQNRSAVLPLKPGLKLAVVGPLAAAQRDLLGSWCGQGDGHAVEPVVDALRHSNVGGQVRYAKGCDIASADRSGFEEAVETVQGADVAVLVLGESADMSGEAASRTSIRLPGVQTELLRQIKQTGKPIVVVLLNGRPLVLEEEAILADALVEAWQPGTRGGQAVADLLFGQCNPSAKLAVSFPRNLGQVPICYSAKNTGRPFDPAHPAEKYKSIYLDSPNDPLFPFGFGLSYTKFAYSNMRVDRNELSLGGKITARIDVNNTGTRPGTEIVQLYIHTHSARVTRPLLELKGFQRIELRPGERRAVEFSVGEKEVTFLRRDMTWGTEPGPFEVFIGPNSKELHAVQCVLRSPGAQYAGARQRATP